jgi:hypothetical protein
MQDVLEEIIPWNKCLGTTDSIEMILGSFDMHLNQSTNNRLGHFSQGDNHYCYTWSF